jgi:hypothetical protein
MKKIIFVALSLLVAKSGFSQELDSLQNSELDSVLITILDSINYEDQSYRLRSDEISKKHGRNSEEYKSLWDTIHTKDSTNLLFISQLIDERGWLGADVIGYEGNSTLFLVIQHSNLETWEKYLPLLREAVTKGNAKGSQLALMEDRAALARGERQVYGSQLTSVPNQEGFVVSPMIDPDNVNKRRAEVGLGTMQVYLKHWEMIWDVEVYKKNLPELEKTLIDAGYWKR